MQTYTLALDRRTQEYLDAVAEPMFPDDEFIIDITDPFFDDFDDGFDNDKILPNALLLAELEAIFADD